MNILGQLSVLPDVPQRLTRLNDVATNLYWTWQPDARRLFRRLDRDLWEASGHSPKTMLRDIAQGRLEEAAADAEYLALYDEVIQNFDAYLKRKTTWFSERSSGKKTDVYAYFCMEYGWHEAVALYSGGLGVLAGDHTKAASDLGVPLVAVGPWFPEGYFHQRVAPSGEQEPFYERLDPSDMPFTVARDGAGNEVRVSVNLQGREVLLRAWHLAVGTVSVYLLDTDVPENAPEDRGLLNRLYGGDQRTRIAQEIVLGIGGVRLLRMLGINPTAWHMNEGHSAFMPLERCRELVEAGLPFAEAREVVAAGTAFTVHTPVAAGNDTFSFDLINQFFGGFWGSLGLSQGEFHELARHDHGWGPVFSMPALALRFSTGRNGVAKLHGETSREIWRDLWPEVPTEEVPITHITNGVHMGTWVAPEIQDLVATVLPTDWRDRFDDNEMWSKVETLDNSKLWDVRQDLSQQSIEFFRKRITRQRARYGASVGALREVEELFDKNALTIGFARRFATYKRATLIFRDLERLARIVNNPEKPVQLVFAGKAHPADKPGQALISTIQLLSQDPRFVGKILFIEDYDMAVGRALTRGVDVWLNNPRRPLEASGTSGQKAAMNGVLNLSILDGWWPEGFDGQNGWAIGSGVNMEASEAADEADAEALYDLLEREVVPLYYDRDAAGVPQAWLERSKNAIATITPQFNARRQVRDYVEMFYAPAAVRAKAFSSQKYAAAADLAAWRRQVQMGWPGLYISAKPLKTNAVRIGQTVEVEAVLHPRDFDVKGLCVELVYSPEANALEHNLHHVKLEKAETYDDGGCLYRASFTPEVSGQLAYGVRVYPTNKLLVSPFDAHAIRWA